jgi:hypothetical protein
MPKPGHAEYMRGWRALQKKRDAKKHQVGVNEGVAMCTKWLREIIGEREYSGFEMARMLTKTIAPLPRSR